VFLLFFFLLRFSFFFNNIFSNTYWRFFFFGNLVFASKKISHRKQKNKTREKKKTFFSCQHAQKEGLLRFCLLFLTLCPKALFFGFLCSFFFASSQTKDKVFFCIWGKQKTKVKWRDLLMLFFVEMFLF